MMFLAAKPLAEVFVLGVVAAFRVQKNRVEKVNKNIASRSYDLSEDLNKSKKSIIEDAIKLLETDKLAP